VRAISRDRDAVVAERCGVADTSRSRTVGLLGRSGIDSAEGLWIVPCASIHTWFMRFAIDVLFLNQGNEVVSVAEEVVPFRLRFGRGAHSVLELAAGRASSVGVRVGETLEFVPVGE